MFFSFSKNQKITIIVEILLLIIGVAVFFMEPKAADSGARERTRARQDSNDGGFQFEPLARGSGEERRTLDGPVNINTADLEELKLIPGVGPSTAQNIIDYRNGPDGVAGTDDDNLFNPVEELTEVTRIGPATVEKMREHLDLGDTTNIPFWGGAGPGGIVDINRAPLEELQSLPGVGPSAAQKIIAYRAGADGEEGTRDDQHFIAVDDLANVSGFGPATLEKLRDLITVGDTRQWSRGVRGSQGDLIDLSTASAAELVTLSGIGPSTAERIIAYREEHGGFTGVEELDEVSGIGPATIDKIRDLVTVSRPRRETATRPTLAPATAAAPTLTRTGSSSAAWSRGKLNINRATADDFEELPGVGPSTAAKILAYRQQHGRFQQTEDIMNVSGIGPATYAKFSNQITVR